MQNNFARGFPVGEKKPAEAGLWGRADLEEGDPVNHLDDHADHATEYWDNVISSPLKRPAIGCE